MESVATALTRVPRLWLAALLFVGALAPTSSAQRYALRTYTDRDGLTNSYVVDIAQERNGVLWVLTRGGLARFDGAEWVRFDPPFQHSGHGRLVLDEHGVPWCVGWTGEIYTLERNQWTSHVDEGPIPNELRFAVALNERSGSPTIARVSTGRGVMLWKDGLWRRVAGRTPNALAPIWAVTTLGDGFLFGTQDGLCAQDAAERQFDLDSALGLPEGRVLALAFEPGADLAPPPDRIDGLWILSDHWLGVVREGRFVLRVSLAEPTPISQNGYVRLVASPTLGVFWGNDVFGRRLAPGATRPVELGVARGLPGDDVHALSIDREQNVWIGQRAGLTRLGEMRFEHYDRAQGLGEDEVSALVALADGRTILGHGRSLSTLQDERIVSRPLPAAALATEAFPRVMSLRPDGESGYFAALWSGAILHVDGAGNERLIDGMELDIDRIADVDATEPGRIWVAGSCGVVAAERGTWRPLADTRLDSTFTRRLARDRAGTLYALTVGAGLAVWRDGFWSPRASLGPPPFNDTWCLLEASSGEKWVGTRGGLARATPDGLVPAPPELNDGLGPVFAIAESSDGRLWFGTSDGLVEWDGARTHRLSVDHGLAGRDVNRAALHLDAEDRLWIGTDRGLSVGSTHFVERVRPAPCVEITGFDLDGVPIDPHEEFELDWRSRALNVRARAVSLVDEHSVGFRWRLADFETDWSQSVGSTHFETRYTHLPPGRYRFELAARAFEGDWSPTVQSASFEVLRPIWLRTWFLALAGLGAVGVGWFVQRSVAQQRYARRLAHEVAARTRELTDSRAEVVREKERLHATLESIGDCVVAVDSAGRVAWVNGAAERALGAGSLALVGSLVGEVLRLERGDGVPFDATVLRAAGGAHASAPGVELRLTPLRGEPRPIELAVAPLSQNGAATGGAVIVLRDVSERTRLEREVARADRLRSLGILAGGIAHDFNNVLTSVGGRVSLISLATGEESDVGRQARAAEKALARARELAQQLLTFARGGEPVRASIAITDLLEDACQLAFSGSRVRVEKEFEPSPWPVEVDRTQVQQVFENLLINARQAMPNGGRALVRVQNVRAGRRQHPAIEDGDFVRVDVEDEGAGIAQEHLQHIFDPFFTTKLGGSGLGLATAYSVVQRHGGAITVRSRLGAGTSFSVFLPASHREAEVTPVERGPLPRIDARILVVDDQADVRAVLAAVFTRLGASVECAGTEDEAVARWREAQERGARFDAAFLDLTMPGGAGGVSVARRVLDVDPDARLIAMSGYSSDPVLAQPARYGFRATLAKPFRMHDVARALELARSDATHERAAGAG